MSINRVNRKKNAFSQVLNEAAHSKNLGWAAKGILWYLLTKPNGWEVRTRDLINQSTDGERIVKSGLKNLEEKGYLVRWCDRTVKGRLEWKSEIFESLEDAKEWTENNPGLLDNAVRLSAGTAAAIGVTKEDDDSPCIQKPCMVAPCDGQPCDGQPCDGQPCDGKRPVIYITEGAITDLGITEGLITELGITESSNPLSVSNGESVPIADEPEKGESQNLILCLEIQEESKVKTGKRRGQENQDTPQVPQPPPSKLSKADCDRFVAAWNEAKPAHFIGMLALTDSKSGKLRKAIFESMVKKAQSIDIAIAALQHYLRTSATDSYWRKDGFKPKLENLASNEKLDLAAQYYRINLEPTPIAAQSASPEISDEPTFQTQANNATANYEKRFANPHKYPALIEAGHGDIMIGTGYLDFDLTLIEVAILHLKKCKLPFEVGDGKRFISNRIKQADWAAIELLKESAATIAGDRKKTEAAIAASANSGSEYYDTSRYYIPEPPVIDLEARAKATEGGRAKMRETIAQALKNRAS